MPVGTWSDEVKAFALERAKATDSASSISRQIRAKFGIHKTRNAVIGVCNRAKVSVGGGRAAGVINGKRSGKARAEHNSQLRKSRPSSSIPLPADPLPPPHVTDIPRKTFLELDEHADCKFVCLPEAAGPFVKQFCGEPRIAGTAYCLAHAHRCFDMTKPRGYLPRLSVAAWGKYQDEAVKEFNEAS